MCILRIFEGAEITDYKLEAQAQILIGRAKNCDIRLNHNHISRYHCTLILMVVDGRFYWIIKDGLLLLNIEAKEAKSTNGTFVNGKIITAITKLKNKDIITFSPVHITINIHFLTLEDEIDKDGTSSYSYENGE